jgi:DNA-binding MurR/RpiR family transcriptional regulator
MALVDSMPLGSPWAESPSTGSLSARLSARLRAGDVVVAISSHGTSSELVQALRCARTNGGYTIGLGSDYDKKLAEEVELPVLVPNDSLDQIEDAHQVIIHILVKALRKYRERDRFSTQAGKEKRRVVVNQVCDNENCVRHRPRSLIFAASSRRWR